MKTSQIKTKLHLVLSNGQEMRSIASKRVDSYLPKGMADSEKRRQSTAGKAKKWRSQFANEETPKMKHSRLSNRSSQWHCGAYLLVSRNKRRFATKTNQLSSPEGPFDFTSLYFEDLML